MGPWTRQPPPQVGIDRSNSLLKSTTGFWKFGPTLYFKDEISGVLGSLSAAASNYTVISNPGGVAPENSSGYFNTNRLNSSLGISGSSSRTIYGVSAQSGGTGAIFECGTPTNQDWSLRKNGSVTAWRLNIFGVVAVDFTYDPGPEGSTFTFICTQSGTAVDIWINGVSRASTTATVNTHDANFLISGGLFWGPWISSTYFLGVANRAWSHSEKVAFSRNPWQVFQPVRSPILIGPPATSSTLLTATLDAAIQEAKSATATLNGVIQTSNSSTATLDGVIRQAMSATASLNAAIQAAMSATGTLDAVITTGAATAHTVTLNAAIQEAKSLTATLNAVIQTSGSASASLNAVIVQANSATATLDATIQSAVTAYALLDAYIFDADAPVVETTTVQAAGRGRRRRYIMPDDSVVMATPTEAEQLVKLFVKPVPPKKPPKRVKALQKIDLVEIEPVSSDTVPTEKITVKKKAVWDKSDLYDRAIRLLAEREILRRRREEEMILLAA